MRIHPLLQSHRRHAILAVTHRLAIRFKRALLQREGELGAVLDCILAYETGEWTAGQTPSAEHMQKAFWDAAEYARQMMSQMAGATSS